MKINLPVTDSEQKLRSDDDLITTTDPKGAITSANQSFINISGFAPDELMGKNHNVVRHPDMPPAAFEDLWNTIKSGKPWMGLVKNRCKNGDFYWVDAYVMPICDGNQIIEYQSVRRAPDQQRVARAEKLYQQISKNGSAGKRWLRPGFVHKLTAGFGLVLAAALSFGVVAGGLAWGSAAAAFGIGMLVSYGLARFLAAPLLKTAADTRNIFSNDLALKVYADSEDEIGQIQLALHMQHLELNSVVARLDDSADQMAAIVNETSSMVQETNAGIQSQQSEIDQLATAVNEMSCTVQEVARNISEAAEAAKKADDEASQGKQEITATIDAISKVATEISQAAEVVNRLQQESETIGSVLEVIRGVAEQTNLLALNAAIEAARAGEQGRGFAVVADEVRSLASRTQESTQEIQHIIESVQNSAREAVDAMAAGTSRVENSVEQVRSTGATLEAIAQAVSAITDMNIQNASATEEQIAVSEEINRNISNISIVAGEHAERSNSTQQKTEELARFAKHLQMLVKQFGK